MGVGGSGTPFDSKWYLYNESSFAARMVVDRYGNVGIGTLNTLHYKLAVEGSIGAREIVITNTVWPWPDYVFRPGYRLQPLSAGKPPPARYPLGSGSQGKGCRPGRNASQTAD